MATLSPSVKRGKGEISKIGTDITPGNRRMLPKERVERRAAERSQELH